MGIAYQKRKGGWIRCSRKPTLDRPHPGAVAGIFGYRFMQSVSSRWQLCSRLHRQARFLLLSSSARKKNSTTSSQPSRQRRTDFLQNEGGRLPRLLAVSFCKCHSVIRQGRNYLEFHGKSADPTNKLDLIPFCRDRFVSAWAHPPAASFRGNLELERQVQRELRAFPAHARGDEHRHRLDPHPL